MAAVPTSTTVHWLGYVKGLLANLGAPDTQNNEDALLGWMAAEQAPEKPYANWNPLNTHKVESGSYPTPDGKGGSTAEQSYPGVAEGIKATGDTIRQSNFSSIFHDLVANAPAAQTLHDVQASKWASGNYGGQGLPGILSTIRSNRTRYEQGLLAARTTTFTQSGGGVLDTAGAVAGEAADAASSAADALNPANIASSLVNTIGSNLQKLVIMGTLVAGGVGLLVAGAYRGVSPETKAQIKGAAVKGAEVAAA